ncbi:MAG: transcription antitermination factor NusB [Gammaproteobacteria bacterium]|nr:MAG: transcription antitermination factor NusB [Gammaproteobacteria bacterium]
MTHKDKQPNKKRSVAQQANVARARARRFAMQAVYQHLLTGDDYADIARQVAQREAHKDYDTFFFNEIIEGIAEFGDNFDVQLTPLINRPLVQLDIVEHAILLVAAYELNNSGTPPKVAINEAIVIAKKFASDDSHKFVNGVLDKLYKSLSR